MSRNKTLGVVAAVLAAAVVFVAAVAWIVQDRDAWLAKSMLDRMAPWEQPAVCYAQTPDSESYFETYDDATGAYKNYVYEIHAIDADGTERNAVLVSFGTMLDENEPFIKMDVKGTSVQAWEYAEAPDA
ncbi:MAG: hypothetical protein Q4D92_00760 [Slackia sp.]|nr:hypothetical protein [Slackia sp.]